MERLIVILICSLFIGFNASSEMLLSKAVIHHTAGYDNSVEEIRKMHVENNGWKDIGYHFVIRKDGTIEEGRSLLMKGAHSPSTKWDKRNRNNWIGIALTGFDEFTDEQYKALAELFIKLDLNYLERHHQDCPGKGFDYNKVMVEVSKLKAKE